VTGVGLDFSRFCYTARGQLVAFGVPCPGFVSWQKTLTDKPDDGSLKIPSSVWGGYVDEYPGDDQGREDATTREWQPCTGPEN